MSYFDYTARGYALGAWAACIREGNQTEQSPADAIAAAILVSVPGATPGFIDGYDAVADAITGLSA